MLQYCMDIGPDSHSHSLTVDSYQLKLPFHVSTCGYFDAGERYFTTRDHLDNHLLIVTTGGAGQLRWKGTTVSLMPGSAVLIHCSTFHDYRPQTGKRWKFFYVHFSGTSMEGYQGPLFEKLKPVQLRSSEYMYDRLKEICRLAEQTDVVASILRSHLISVLLTEMVCSLAEEKSNADPLNRADISELALYIRKNFHMDLHLDDFMQITRLSRHYLIHMFQRQMGMAPYRYLHMCRINRAQILLQNTDYTVGQIAGQVGYQTSNAFSRQFRSFTGLTPAEYRQQSLRPPR